MPRVISKQKLVAHSGASHVAFDVGAKLSLIGSDVLMIEYVVVGSVDELAIAQPVLPKCRDELWKHTCFEAFIGRPTADYVEFNFAPSREWAMYRFEGYRSGMQPAIDLRSPKIFPEHTTDRRFGLTAFVELGALWNQGATHLGLSAIIEEKGGAKSYWALAHPPSGPPDFHHPDCFALTLPPPKAS